MISVDVAVASNLLFLSFNSPLTKITFLPLLVILPVATTSPVSAVIGRK